MINHQFLFKAGADKYHGFDLGELNIESLEIFERRDIQRETILTFHPSDSVSPAELSTTQKGDNQRAILSLNTGFYRYHYQYRHHDQHGIPDRRARQYTRDSDGWWSVRHVEDPGFSILNTEPYDIHIQCAAPWIQLEKRDLSTGEHASLSVIRQKVQPGLNRAMIDIYYRMQEIQHVLVQIRGVRPDALINFGETEIQLGDIEQGALIPLELHLEMHGIGRCDGLLLCNQTGFLKNVMMATDQISQYTSEKCMLLLDTNAISPGQLALPIYFVSNTPILQNRVLSVSVYFRLVYMEIQPSVVIYCRHNQTFIPDRISFSASDRRKLQIVPEPNPEWSRIISLFPVNENQWKINLIESASIPDELKLLEIEFADISSSLKKKLKLFFHA